MEKKYKLGILVSGRGSNLQAIIDAIQKGEVNAEIAVIISNKKKALALEKGDRYGIPALFLDPKLYGSKKDYDLALVEKLQSYAPDLICLAGYMRILRTEFIQAFAGRIINIHPSLLPSFPGLHAQKQALDHGVKIAGCTVHLVEEEVDAGPIILQAAVPVLNEDNEDSLSARILQQEHIIYPQAIQMFIEGRVGNSMKAKTVETQ